MPSDRLPVVFLGHGNPMNTLADNRWTRSWRALGEELRSGGRPPRAVLCVSAHWYGWGTEVTAMAGPRTIHDFGGFPQALFDVQYPAPGDPALADQVIGLLAPQPVAADHDWGLDHGTWSVLAHVFPDAEVPIVQLSIDATHPPAHHLDVGRRLAPLRDDGVLIVGSGNIVHNLGRIAFGLDEPFDWNVRFDAHIERALEAGDDDALVHYEDHPDGPASVPTPEHYLPLLYVAGARHADDELRVITDGYDAGSLSMRAIAFGTPLRT